MIWAAATAATLRQSPYPCTCMKWGVEDTTMLKVPPLHKAALQWSKCRAVVGMWGGCAQCKKNGQSFAGSDEMWLI